MMKFVLEANNMYLLTNCEILYFSFASNFVYVLKTSSCTLVVSKWFGFDQYTYCGTLDSNYLLKVQEAGLTGKTTLYHRIYRFT